jgi:hypothetical protein
VIRCRKQMECCTGSHGQRGGGLEGGGNAEDVCAGRIWVKSGNAQSTVLVSNAILNSEFITAAQAQRMVKALAEHVKQQAQ